MDAHLSTEKKPLASKIPSYDESLARKSIFLEQSGCGGGGGGGCHPINPHYRSEERRQGSAAFFWSKLEILSMKK